MKKLDSLIPAALAAFLLFAVPARAQIRTADVSAPAGTVPGNINYQGRLIDNGFPVTATRSMTFRLYDALTGGTLLSTIGPQSVSVNQGIFGTTLSMSTSALAGPLRKYLEVQVDGTVLSPREPLNSVPYALIAKSLEENLTISSVTVGGQLVSSGTLSVSTITALAGGSVVRVTANLTVVSSVTASAFFGDASHLTGAVDATKVLKAGDGMTGTLTMVGGSTITVQGSAFSVGATTLVVGGGRVGVGTASPALPLDVEGAAQFGSGAAKSTMTAAGGLTFDSGYTPSANQDAATKNYVDNQTTSGSGWSKSGTSVRLTNGTDNVLVQSTLTVQGNAFSVGGSTLAAIGGRVGVGTASPAVALDVVGAAQFGSGAAKSSFTAAGALNMAAGAALNLSGAAGNVVSQASMTASAFFGDASHLTGASDSTRVAKAGDTMTGGLNLNASSMTIVDTNNSHTYALLVATGNSVGNYMLFVATGGRVGIGTAVPTAALDVQTSTPGLKVGGTCVSGTCPSDARLKADIRYMNGSLDVISRLRPASYRYTADPAGLRGYGLIAQDLEPVAPALVRKGEDGFLRVDYSPLEMMLIDAVREQQEQIKAMRRELDALKPPR